jgi:serine/threonine protein kinase
MVEHFEASSPPVIVEEEGPPLFLTVRNTHNVAHNWSHPSLGGYSTNEDVSQLVTLKGAGPGGCHNFVDERFRATSTHGGGAVPNTIHEWELALEMHVGSEEGELANERIQSCKFTLHHTSFRHGADVVELHKAPFCIQRHGWDEFPVNVVVQLVDIHGGMKELEFAHYLKLDKDVATTVYRLDESRVAYNMPFSCTKVREANETLHLAALSVASNETVRAAGSVTSATSSVGHSAELNRVASEAIVEQLHEIGRGGFGIVFSARTSGEHGLPAKVAVKQLVASSTANEDAFWLEAKVVGSLPSHPNVIRMFGWCQAFGKPSIVFELCEEGDLHSFLKKRKDTSTSIYSLSPIMVHDLCSQVAKGMAHIHENRLYHRDLKPQNVLLTREGVVGPSGLRVVVTDLGLAKNLTESINLTASMQGSQVGTYVYMAPETISKSVFSQGTDVWSYATLIWELLVGQAPYSYLGAFNPVAVAYQVGFGSLVPEQLAWPAPYDEILSRSFSKDHHQRPSFKDILAKLENAQTFLSTPYAEFVSLQHEWAAQLVAKFGQRNPSQAAKSVRHEEPATSVVVAQKSVSSLGTTVVAPDSDVETPDTPMGATVDHISISGPNFSDANVQRLRASNNSGGDIGSPICAEVAAILKGTDYSALLTENGFDTLDDFEMYTEDDLVEMGFKKVHARKLRRASSMHSPMSSPNVVVPATPSRLALVK